MGGISTIQESIVRILKTPLGSRVGLPLYGSELYKLRDRTLNDEYRLKATAYVFDAIRINEPRVKVERVEFSVDAVSGVIGLLVYLQNGEVVGAQNNV